MRNLFSLLLVAVLVPIGAQALSAQQTYGNPTTTTPATQHARTHHRRHQAVAKRAHRVHKAVAAERTEMRHARAERRERHVARRRVMTRTMTAMPEPTVLGTPAPGFPPPPHAEVMGNMGMNNPSSGRLRRLASGLITPDAARSIALRTIPNGTSVNKIRLRTEDGRQVYDVKVITPNQSGNEMVRVDAHTGAVLETKNVDNPVGAVKGAVNKAVNKVKHP